MRIVLDGHLGFITQLQGNTRRVADIVLAPTGPCTLGPWQSASASVTRCSLEASVLVFSLAVPSVRTRLGCKRGKTLCCLDWRQNRGEGFRQGHLLPHRERLGKDAWGQRRPHRR